MTIEEFQEGKGSCPGKVARRHREVDWVAYVVLFAKSLRDEATLPDQIEAMGRRHTFIVQPCTSPHPDRQAKTCYLDLLFRSKSRRPLKEHSVFVEDLRAKTGTELFSDSGRMLTKHNAHREPLTSLPCHPL